MRVYECVCLILIFLSFFNHNLWLTENKVPEKYREFIFNDKFITR